MTETTDRAHLAAAAGDIARALEAVAAILDDLADAHPDDAVHDVGRAWVRGTSALRRIAVLEGDLIRAAVAARAEAQR